MAVPSCDRTFTRLKFHRIQTYLSSPTRPRIFSYHRINRIEAEQDSYSYFHTCACVLKKKKELDVWETNKRAGDEKRVNGM